MTALKKWFLLALASILIVCTVVPVNSIPAHADSFVELPNKNDWRYKTYAPYSQTKSYKIWYQTSQPISKVIYANQRAKKFANGKLVSYTGDLMTAGGFVATKFGAAAASSATMYVGIVLVGAKYTTIKIANNNIKYLNGVAKNKIKSQLKVVTRVKFKWTNPNKFKYKVVGESYITYKGKKLANTTRTRVTEGRM